jgi:hypothetical protein
MEAIKRKLSWVVSRLLLNGGYNPGELSFDSLHLIIIYIQPWRAFF